MNQYPLWKQILIITIVVVGVLYAMPNLFGEDPAVQVTSVKEETLDQSLVTVIENALKADQIAYKRIDLEEKSLLVRFNDADSQLRGKELIRAALGSEYLVALNLAPSTPGWLVALDAEPMNLGLDLRGGIHLLIDVDMESAMEQADKRYLSDYRSLFREDKIRYRTISSMPHGGVEVKFADIETRNRAIAKVREEYPTIIVKEVERDDAFFLQLTISEDEQREIKRYALDQNITTLRNRVNELGVSEPVVQQQGERRIVVQLPGVQDTATAVEILGKTATLEYRMVDDRNDVGTAVAGRVPAGSELLYDRDGMPVLLKKTLIITGEQVVDANSGFDPRDGSPNVTVTLDAKGAKRMLENTRENVGKPMAVVFIENKVETHYVDGEIVKKKKLVREVISVATIREEFGKRFQTTGLDSPQEARTLALLLRAGALAAPIEIVEERTIGPSLGQENIDQGFLSVMIGMVCVLIFMAVYYRVFGLIANVALVVNLVLIIAVLSMLQATLTLPGIAGIVLTVGMAVDANVLIFERIREEIRNGNTPQASIHAGYAKALTTIADANITTLIAAVVLFGLGTGPIKGFAVTLSIGIITSMFTAIMGTRALVNIIYGGKRVSKLAI